jgi:tetratricopeptide (TPR) repeat protein
MGEPLPGTTIGHYEIVARLGGGGMGVVYAARDTKLGRHVALKFLPPQWSHDESAKQRFVREAQAASATDHPNICTIHDIESTPDGRLFIVMAQYEGQTLKQRLESGPVPVEEAIDIAAQVAEGLARAHTHGVVHRDIKPGNLMLTEDGVRILDFGLAKFANAQQQLTMEGSTLGTIAYMSPEQTRGDDADARTDIWAVAVVLYEMLTGEPPFKGGYPEAIAHAIRTDPPASIRARGLDIPEALEQIVFRALHKNPAVRFQSARDLARALRLLQGRTLPLDLRTEPVPTPSVSRPRTPMRWRPGRMAAAVALVVGLIGMPLWLLAPVRRTVIVVVPVVNETGYAELDPYRLALTQQFIASLIESRVVRVVPFDRTLQIVRQFRATGDISSREAVQALATATDAVLIVAPVLLHEDGAWRARIDVTTRSTSATNAYLADPISSALPKDAARRLMDQLATLAESHVTGSGPRRAYLAGVLRASLGFTASRPPGMRSLDAVKAFADGLDAYEQQEYSAALEAFTTAANDDSTNPLPSAWRSRIAQLMGQPRLAREAAAEAERRGPASRGETSRLFVEAVIAENGADEETAAARYRQLTERWTDEPSWAIELGAFFDRQERYADAITSYTSALALDEHLARPHLELCRLYGPIRRNDPPNARAHGLQALARYQALGSVTGQAQARWCLVDVLNVGDAAARAEAATHAQLARTVLGTVDFPYNRARADHYLATAAATQGRFVDAVRAWEASLVETRAGGNATLEATVLTNLSVAYERLGDITRAIEYRQQGYTLFEAIGNQQRAAQNQANGAFLLIEYGVDPVRGLADVQNALAVVRAQNDRNFEVFCLRILGSALRHAGRHEEAARELNRAIAIAAEGNLEEDLADARIELARLRFDEAEYGQARALLLDVVPKAAGLDSVEAALDLARTELRLGLLDVAATTLDSADAERLKRGDTRLQPVVDLIRGELAYESGRLTEARPAFARAAAAWSGEWPHDAAVEGRAYLGLLEGDTASVASSLDRAQQTGRSAIAARARLFLARLDIAVGRLEPAARTLRDMTTASPPLGRELRAQAEYWTARALVLRGDADGARAAFDRARVLVNEIRQSLAEGDRPRFSSRADIRAIG